MTASSLTARSGGEFTPCASGSPVSSCRTGQVQGVWWEPQARRRLHGASRGSAKSRRRPSRARGHGPAGCGSRSRPSQRRRVSRAPASQRRRPPGAASSLPHFRYRQEPSTFQGTLGAFQGLRASDVQRPSQPGLSMRSASWILPLRLSRCRRSRGQWSGYES